MNKLDVAGYFSAVALQVQSVENGHLPQLYLNTEPATYACPWC